jgi:hypothetical protein
VRAGEEHPLVLQLRDPLPRSHQLRLIGAGHARDLAAVDQLLPSPRVYDLRADAQVIGDLRDRPPRGHQIQDLPPELRRIPPRHNAFLESPDE